MTDPLARGVILKMQRKFFEELRTALKGKWDGTLHVAIKELIPYALRLVKAVSSLKLS